MPVVPHHPGWAADYRAEAGIIRAAISDTLIAVHHIGSTAIPDILAKPIIDMLGVVRSLDAADDATPALVAAGYEAMGAFGIEGRRYFRKHDGAGVRTHHLHVFASGSPHITRHLAFRDYLRAHPERAAAYSGLKRALAADPASYVERKGPFVQAVQAEALAWAAARNNY